MAASSRAQTRQSNTATAPAAKLMDVSMRVVARAVEATAAGL
jgi:hypothetical protein